MVSPALTLGLFCLVCWVGHAAPQRENGHCSGDGTCDAGAEDGDGALGAFEAWIRKSDLPVNHLKVASIESYGRGTLATRPLKKGSLYISVPERLLIGPEKVDKGSALFEALRVIRIKSGISRDIWSRIVDMKSQLLMFLLREKHVTKDSLWKAYIEALPNHVTVPSMFNASELAALQASEVADGARSLARQMRQHYDKLRGLVFSQDRKFFPKKAFSFKEWQWAFILYDSRVIQLNRHTGRGNTPTFIPLIDMVNCRESTDKTFIVFNEQTRTADMFADEDFAAGEQVFETYGNKSNYEYLLYNGFVMRDNPNQCAYISLPSPKDPVNTPPARLCLNPSDKDIPQALLHWGRQMQALTAEDGLQHVLRFLDKRLSDYGTSEQHDAALLDELRARNDPREEHLRLAVAQRLHEKSSLSASRKKLSTGRWKCCPWPS